MNFRKILISAVFCTAALAPAFAFAQVPAKETATPELLLEAYENAKWSRAIMLAEELLAADPDNAGVLTILGVSATNINEFARAEAAFEKALTLKPDDPISLVNLCGARLKLKNENAIDTCLKAAEKDPNNAALWNLIGQEYENSKKLDDARNAYSKASALDPKNLSYLTAVTAIDFTRKDYDKALEITEKAINDGNENVILYINAVVAANKLGAYDKALAIVDRGFEKYHDPQLKQGKAEALNGLHRFEEAIPIWKELLNEVNKNHQSYPRIQYGCARAMIAASCDEAKYSQCGSETEDACCAREREALELMLAAKDDKALRKQAPEFDEYLGLAFILNGKLEEAEAILTVAATNNLEKNSAGAPAALAAALYSFSDAKDRRAALVYYTQAASASEDIRDPERVIATRAWPPRIAGILKKLQAEENAQKASKTKKGCSCEISAMQQPALPVAAWLTALLSLLALLAARRKSYRA
ncbi:MAG: tetratricopeptide repeat protein [Proteobacteria bacterium]|nr:tetratricopeptide repeat protein [Pseudomonadota bacterium]